MAESSQDAAISSHNVRGTDVARAKLRELVRAHGPSLGQDADQCEGLMRKACPDYPREVNLLLTAAAQAVPAALLDNKGSPRQCVGALIQKLQDQAKCTADWSRWAVESWALALGVIAESDADPQVPAGAGGYAVVAVDPASPESANSRPTGPLQPAGDEDAPVIQGGWKTFLRVTAIAIAAAVVMGAIIGAIFGNILASTFHSRLWVVWALFGGLAGAASGAFLHSLCRPSTAKRSKMPSGIVVGAIVGAVIWGTVGLMAWQKTQVVQDFLTRWHTNPGPTTAEAHDLFAQVIRVAGGTQQDWNYRVTNQQMIRAVSENTMAAVVAGIAALTTIFTTTCAWILDRRRQHTCP